MRRVKSEQSIGDRLKKARIRKKISVAEVEEATKIRAKFILALESDSWEQIPSEVYGRGYLELYSAFLQQPPEVIMKQYDRERNTYARNCQEAIVELSPKSRFKVPRFFLTPRFFVVAFVALGLAIGGVEVYRQLSVLTSAPSLSIQVAHAEEADLNDLVIATNKFTFSGVTSIGATVKVDGKLVPVDQNGNFTATVDVSTGVNAVYVQAINPAGHESDQTLSVTVKK